MINEDANKSMRTMSANSVRSITEALLKLFPDPFSRAAEAFEELGRLALSPRGYRKAIRLDEKNRRRRLKGLPEKPRPYQDNTNRKEEIRCDR